MFENLRRQIAESSSGIHEICLLLANLPVPAVISDKQGHVIELNASFTKAFGYQKEDMRSLKAWWSQACGENAIEWRETEQEAGMTKLMPLILTSKDGRSCPVEYIESCGSIFHLGLFLDQTEVRQDEETLRRLVKASSAHFGKELFESIILELSAALQADYALIGQLQQNTDVPSILTRAVVADGNLIPNFEYALPGTPCEYVMEQKVCVYPADVANLFPSDTLLKELDVQAYVGTPLIASTGANIGIMVTLYRSPLESARHIQSILTVFAGRVGSEIERLSAQSELENRLAELQRWYDLTLGREERNAELKHEVNDLLAKLGLKRKYDV